MLFAEDTSAENSTPKSTLKNKIFGSIGYTCFGFSAGTVFIDNYDTGFGFGARIKRPLLNPLLEFTTSGYLWGASTHNMDITSIGIEESLTLKKTIRNNISIYSGIIAGYYVTNERTEPIQNNNSIIIENNNASFETYITSGVTYPFSKDRTLFSQVKYGLSQDNSELHILIGMFFCK
ncbi:hypothetical protein ACFL6K_05025 [Candidatus Latescibacterota bacterium]